ncbi:MAG: hypothetical protein ACYDEA_04160 [Candidatus Dormibacteria bacterium]
MSLPPDHATIAQRSPLSPGRQATLHQLNLPEPPRFYDFRPHAA